MKKILIIVGPTASGKTALSIRFAKLFNGEIINGDAMQVYKGMDIGTAKITESEMSGIPHHLFSEISISEENSIFEYRNRIHDKIEEITNRSKLPIIVGGSGLYIQSIVYDYQYISTNTTEYKDDPSLSNEELWDELNNLDEKSAKIIHKNNRKRVVRALGLAKYGEKKSDIDAKIENKNPLFNFLAIGVDIDRNIVCERINTRVDQMIDDGLEFEVVSILQQNPSQTAISAIGYKEWLPFFRGEINRGEVIERIKIHTRQLAKKQMTWFKNQRMPIVWVSDDSLDSVIENINTWKDER